MPQPRIRVLFVCLGNICRSPLAEHVFRELAEREGIADRFEVDSAGTSAYHIGEPPDRRTAAEARRRGLELNGSARQLAADDFARFDHIVAMDEENLQAVRAHAGARAGAAEVHLLRAFDPEPDGRSVPDPYFGGEDGFRTVHDIVERSCRGLLEHIRERHGI